MVNQRTLPQHSVSSLEDGSSSSSSSSMGNNNKKQPPSRGIPFLIVALLLTMSSMMFGQWIFATEPTEDFADTTLKNTTSTTEVDVVVVEETTVIPKNDNNNNNNDNNTPSNVVQKEQTQDAEKVDQNDTPSTTTGDSSPTVIATNAPTAAPATTPTIIAAETKTVSKDLEDTSAVEEMNNNNNNNNGDNGNPTTFDVNENNAATGEARSDNNENKNVEVTPIVDSTTTEETTGDTSSSSSSTAEETEEEENWPSESKIQFNTAELCANPNTILSDGDHNKDLWECGRRRLMDEFGISVSLESIEVDSESGIGHLTAALCGDDKQQCMDTFSASDLFLWVRFRRSTTSTLDNNDNTGGGVFAVNAHAVDCRSWRADFHIPLEGNYHVDVMTIWKDGDPTKWINDDDHDLTQDIRWVGEPFSPGVSYLHGQAQKNARYMSCLNYCLVNSECTHWTFHKEFGMTTKSSKCQLYKNVTGTIDAEDTQSGYVQAGEKRVMYLGGLSVGANNGDTRRECRELAHVLGSPARISVTAASDGTNQVGRLSSLPWCAASDIGKKREEEGFWAPLSAVYPERNDMTCPKACELTNDHVCTPNDTLTGICSFNDLPPQEEVLRFPEPSWTEIAWVERDCRYRVGDADLFKGCLKDKKIDAVALSKTDIFGDLMDRWQLSPSEVWSGSDFNNDFAKLDGEDWLVFANKESMLGNLWKSRGHDSPTDRITAVIVMQLWQDIKEQIYAKRQYDRPSFEQKIRKSIGQWKSGINKGWLSEDSVFVAILAPLPHESYGDPKHTYEALEYYNEIARALFEEAGWKIVDFMAISRSRPDYRAEWLFGTVGGQKADKRAGGGIVYAITNALYNTICSL